MSYNIYTIPYFDKQFKRLAKKHSSLKSDFSELVKSIKYNALAGTPLGKDCYKIRLAISSKRKGKSSGARVITYFAVNNSTIYLLSIYDKSEQSDISDKELLRLLENVK